MPTSTSRHGSKTRHRRSVNCATSSRWSERHDFDSSLVDSHRERDEAIDAARSQLNGDNLGAFNELLGICTVANFAWWNEDHNYYIDLRSSIPLRRGALAAAEAVGADTYDDTTFLFFPELQQVCNGEVAWKDKQSIATARHEYYDHYQDLRMTIPKVVGTLPEKVEDPVLIEIFGMHKHYFDGLKADLHTTQLTGFPASAGTYTGRARVMVSATELFDLEEGEILVTEATSPNWTPAFAIIGACVCDGGGSLTHAATVSREYGIPCVVGTSVATQRIKTGDLLEVDGTRGVVTIKERAAHMSVTNECDQMSVKGKRIVVTGGARGIGARLVGELRERGAEVTSTDILAGLRHRLRRQRRAGRDCAVRSGRRHRRVGQQRRTAGRSATLPGDQRRRMGSDDGGQCPRHVPLCP